MDTHELESILARRDLEAAERARDDVGPHTVFLANYYWRTPDWVERSLAVHMVQDQRGPHLRSLFADFLRAPEAPAEYRDHFELTKAVCLVQLKGDLGLFSLYEKDRVALRRDIAEELGGGDEPALLGVPTPIAPPPPSPTEPARATGAEVTTAEPDGHVSARTVDPARKTVVLVVALLVLVLGVATGLFALQRTAPEQPAPAAGPNAP